MNYVITVIISLSLLIIVTRALPFAMSRFMTPSILKIGKLLPAYIMLLLVLYNIDMQQITVYPYAWQAFVALGAMIGLHLWLRNELLSIFCSTALYLILLYGFAS